MAPLVVDATCRFIIRGTFLGQDCFNMLDVAITDMDVLTSREEACRNVAGDLLNQWDDEILGLLNNNYVALAVDWVDLDSLSGSTGTRTSTDGNSWPKAGGQTAQPLAGHTYARVRKNVAGSARNSRRGILRLGGLSEPNAEGNTLTAETITQVGGGMEALKDGINGSLGENYTANLVVVHNPASGPTSTSVISTFSVDSRVGTLRRRMPGYGQ